jgi:hypothetical protein
LTSARVAVLGGDDVRAAVVALGFELVDVSRAQIAIVDARDRAQLALAAALPAALPRLTVAAPEDRAFFEALGIDRARIVTGVEPAELGPALVALLPSSVRSATKVVVIAGVRGGVGRTLLAANLARRVAPQLRVCALDATGTGALSWWLRAAPKAWPDAEAIASEMTSEHLALISDTNRGMRVLGGASVAPTETALLAAVRVASSTDDLVIVDAPLSPDALTRALTPIADRRLILAYDDACSAALLDADPPRERDWLIASQSKRTTVSGRAAFRALPRDESAVASAAASRSAVGGALGRAYDELAELVTIDATDT